MSDLLNSASLVMIPSGYKEDTVYSVVPSDGSGDLQFTRSSNGTRVNSAGLVEVCPWNEAQQSNTFGTSPWSNTLDTGATLTYTANYGTAPDGTATAGRLQMALNGGAYAQKNQIISVITGQQYTYSVWMRSLSGTKIVIFCYDNTNNITASVTTEWQRFTHTFTGNSQVYARFVLEAGTSTSVDLLIYGAQLNIGSTAKPYFPTTDRLNVPRLTYQNGGGGCPSLLLEKQSTNLLSYSQDFTQSSWQKLGQGIADTAVITANYAISPDGTQNATRFVCNLNGSNSSADRSWMITTFTAQATSTISIWIKLNTSGTKTIIFSDSGGTTKTISGTDWQRIDGTFSGASGEYRIGLIGGTGTSDTLDCCIWGGQAEASSYPTSYIPTTSSSATRVADLGANDVFGSTYTLDADFCLFQDFKCFDFGNFPVFWSGGNYGTGGDYRSYMITYGTTDLLLYGINETLTARINSLTFSANTRYKVAVRRVGSTINWFINGTKYSNAAGTTTTTTVKIRSISGASLGGQNVMKLNEAIIFKDKTLTDEDCISLTTI